MLAGDSPTGDFQLHPVAIREIYFSTNKIDAATSRECPQRFINCSRSGDFQQPAMQDSVLMKELIQGDGIDRRGPQHTVRDRRIEIDRRPRALLGIDVQSSLSTIP